MVRTAALCLCMCLHLLLTFLLVPSRVSIFPWKCTIVFKYYIGGISIANTAWCLLMLHHWNTEIPKLFRWSRDVESNRVKKMMRGPHNISSAAISTAHFKDSTYLYLHNRTYESVLGKGLFFWGKGFRIVRFWKIYLSM